MARNRVKLQWIADNVARKATYKKRMKGLIKKVRELSILCGVDACLITYSRYHQKPEVWPSLAEAEKVIVAFRNRPQNDQSKKVLNQELFTWQRILKARDELVKQQMKNRKKEIENLRVQCLGGNGAMLQGLERRDLLDLVWAIDNQLEAVKKRIIGDGDAAAAAAAAGKTSFDIAIDALRNQLLNSEQDQNENMGHSLGVPLVHDVSDFWHNPFIL